VSRRGLFTGVLFGFERRQHALLPFPAFLARLSRNFLSALVLVGGSLAIGMFGYHGFESLGWTDSFLNAAMLLSGMGPLESPQTEAGKLFAGIYALYSGLAVLAIASLMLAPLVHRLLHRFHAEDDDTTLAPASPANQGPTHAP
jgi:TRAP-type C4-dicarboxylate transport system permease small subunit